MVLIQTTATHVGVLRHLRCVRSRGILFWGIDMAVHLISKYLFGVGIWRSDSKDQDVGKKTICLSVNNICALAQLWPFS